MRPSKRPATRLAIAVLAIAVFTIFSTTVTAQTEWTRHPGNPVLSPGTPPAWDKTMAAAVTVIYHEGIYKTWYEGDDSFGYATSPDGLSWTKYAGNPVMSPGPPGSWDVDNIDRPSVVVVAGTFHMWYSGVDDQNDNRIGHATSPDGINWTKDPANPVIVGEPLQWDAFEAMHPFVIYEDGVFKMWYNGHDGLTQRILYATSPDGTVWTKFTSLFMLERGQPGSWDENELGPMCVLRANDGYHMWYTGWDFTPVFAIGYATSPDGISWTKALAENPVLGPGSPGSWDDAMVAIPDVMLIDSVLTMWYGGTDGSLFHTGIATSATTLVPTFLHSFRAAHTGAGIEIRWRLSEAGAGATFGVFRSVTPDDRFVAAGSVTTPSRGLEYAFVDDTVEPGSTYRYQVSVSDEDGTRLLFETRPVSTPPMAVELEQVSPNPFNPQTTIVFTTPLPGRVRLDIYDTAGRLVSTLVDGPVAAGRHTESWDGRDRSGARAATGVYFIRLESRGTTVTKKAVLLK